MNLTETSYKSGFVAIIGKPNVGKSTLLNALLGEKISIVTPKAQTTRRSLLGILSSQEYQMIFVDTPGVIEPKYKLHEFMLENVKRSLEGADVILLMLSVDEKHDISSLLALLHNVNKPILVALNKCDLFPQEVIVEKITELELKLPYVKRVFPIAALHDFNVESLVKLLVPFLPVGEAFYDTEQLTDKSERYLVSEIIREKIFLNCQKEIPYSVEVSVSSFQERESIIYIEAIIHVEREGQKIIIIGKGGEKLKKIGSQARVDIEALLQKQVFLQTKAIVSEDWKYDEKKLRSLGYE